MIRAHVHMPYFSKFLYISLACFAYALWCLYDARVAYPKKLQIARAYETFPTTAAGQRDWTALAEEKGWPTAVPEKTAVKVEALIVNQYLSIAGCAMLGTFLFSKWWFARGSWIEGDEHILKNSRGQQCELSELLSINKRKWESKGIAVLKYRNGTKKRKFVLDDYKFDRESTGQLLAFAEARLSEPEKPTETEGC
ncbi:MAG: hypothetical protein AAGD07_09250 [Planctomycetota bacterium]